MAVPNAPMPLFQQVKSGSSITISVPLRGMGAGPTFIDGGTAYNSGDPTATYTIVLTANVPGTATANINNNGALDLCNLIDRLYREGTATVA